MTNLVADFDGEVIPINPNYDAVLGIPSEPTIMSELEIDLAVIAVPPETAIGTSGTLRTLVSETSSLSPSGSAKQVAPVSIGNAN